MKILHELMAGWPMISPEGALEVCWKWEKKKISSSSFQLLGAAYADEVIREYAVKCIALMSDNEVRNEMKRRYFKKIEESLFANSDITFL